MAQGILENKVKEQGLSCLVDSAGTSSYHVGDPPDSRAISKSAEKNIDISSYRGRQFLTQDFDEFDQIFVMDNHNYRDVLALARNEEDEKKVKMILNLIYPEQNMSVPDPYYGGDEGFENVYKMLDEACTIIAKKLVK